MICTRAVCGDAGGGRVPEVSLRGSASASTPSRLASHWLQRETAQDPAQYLLAAARYALQNLGAVALNSRAQPTHREMAPWRPHQRYRRSHDRDYPPGVETLLLPIRSQSLRIPPDATSKSAKFLTRGSEVKRPTGIRAA